ncbi:MAG: hypothetical protein ACK4R2_06625 [Roseateles sp.]
MTVWLLLLASLGCGWLAVDAWRLRASGPMPYAIEAAVRGEPLDGVPLVEQRQRQQLARRQLGALQGVVWVWAILAVGFAAAALFAALA